MWTGSNDGVGVGASERIGPSAHRDGGPDLLIGGFAPAALHRAGHLADGWIAVGMPTGDIARCFGAVESARAHAERPGRSRLVACHYVACGDDATEESDRNVERYYRFGGDALVQLVRSGVLRTASTIRDARAELEAIGVDEHVLVTTVANVNQLTRITDAM